MTEKTAADELDNAMAKAARMRAVRLGASLLNRCAEYVSCMAQMDGGAHYDPKLFKLIKDLVAAGVPEADDDPPWGELLEGMRETKEEEEARERIRLNHNKELQ